MPNFKPHPIGRFPYWADAEAATETEAIGDKKKTVVPIPIPPYYYYSDQIETIEDLSSTDSISQDTLDYSDTNPFPWEQWSHLPKVEREAEMKEAQKEAMTNAENEDYAPWADAKSATETEAIGHHSGPHPMDPDAVEPDFGQTGKSIRKESGMDGLRESDPLTAAADSLTGAADESTGNFTSTVRRFFSQSDSVTGDPLANADTNGSPSWFHMHHDDGIMDGYLDVGADASGFDSFLLRSGSDLITPIAEPFADAATITDLVTGQSSPMEAAIDPLVAAGPLDAVKVDEPRNNDF